MFIVFKNNHKLITFLYTHTHNESFFNLTCWNNLPIKLFNTTIWYKYLEFIARHVFAYVLCWRGSQCMWHLQWKKRKSTLLYLLLKTNYDWSQLCFHSREMLSFVDSGKQKHKVSILTNNNIFWKLWLETFKFK